MVSKTDHAGQTLMGLLGHKTSTQQANHAEISKMSVLYSVSYGKYDIQLWYYSHFLL